MTEPRFPRTPTIIEPLEFRRAGGAPRRRGRLLRWFGLALVMLVTSALALVAGFVFTARSVEITFDPEPEVVDVDGSPLRFQLARSLLLWPGEYAVHAELEGYHPLDETFVVARDGARPVPLHDGGAARLLDVQCVGADEPERPLAGATVSVDGAAAGTAPLEAVELERGAHTLRVEVDRYQARETEVTIEGFGRRQATTIELRPDWADVEVSSVPADAELWVDGTLVDRTPCTVELRSGAHALELRREGYEPWTQSLVVVAEQPVSLTGITLALARGRIVVTTEPAGANVMIDGAYAGASPVETAVEPDREVAIQVSLNGYTPEQRTARVASQETETIDIALTALLGTVRLDVLPADTVVLVDGVAIDGIPPELDLPAVTHQLEFRRDGYTTGDPFRPAADRPRAERDRPSRGDPRAAGRGAQVDRGEWIRALADPPRPFQMGASRREQGRRSNETLRAVRLERPYLIGQREVTNAEFRAFKADHASGALEEVALDGANQPVVQVTWDDAARFCNWLSARDQLRPRTSNVAAACTRCSR